MEVIFILKAPSHSMEKMSAQEDWKKNAAEEAASLVEDEMKVGLGSGSTLAEVVKVLGDKDSGADFVAASAATQQLADKMGLNLFSLEGGTRLDLAIDGADEIDANLSVIKGGGGAHTRERMVASAAEEVTIVVDKTKLAEVLGKKDPVPVEVVPFSYEYTAGLLKELGGEPELRRLSSGGPFVTDNGNYIVDVDMGEIKDPESLTERLNQVPGVIDNGIFVGVADRVIVGHEGGCEVLGSKENFSRFKD